MESKPLRISFCWQGISTNQHRWHDGLWLALKHLEKRHTVGYFEPDDRVGIDEFKPDVLLYWAALCETQKELVASYPYPKAICFAGGPITTENKEGFDLYFTESTYNEVEFENFGKPWKRAFGINEEIFKPENLDKIYDGIFWGAFAKWKRPELFAQALEERGLAIGQHQDHEKECYQVCQKWGNTVKEEIPRTDLVHLINQSKLAVNPANFWGGGQRMTLEAMACNIPVIVMSDSPKNREYVEESGFGKVVEPDVQQIKNAVEELKDLKCNSRDYVLSKFSSVHYANALEEGLKQICNQKSQ